MNSLLKKWLGPTFKAAATKLQELKTKCGELRPWTPQDGYKIPPVALRNKVRLGQLSREGFISEGKQVYDTLRKTLSENNIIIDKNSTVFEFGCGCGRVGRHFLKDGIKFSGSDVDSELICWSQLNLPEGHFFVNNFTPPLEAEDNSFDVTYAISVLTHIPVEHQIPWLYELKRVTKPAGIVIVSVIEADTSKLNQDVTTTIRNDFGIKRSWLGKGTAPAKYLDVNHSKDFIEREWNKVLTLVDYRPKAIRGRQSLVVMKK